MSDGFAPHWLLLGVVPALILMSLAFSYRRAQRWEHKIRTHGQVHCRSCGYVGELLVRTLSAQDNSSSNLRLVCQQCNCSDWIIPEDQKAG
jgi:hypothetical protein